MVNMEMVIMELIVNSGDARSKALEAVSAASEGDFEQAEKMIEECDGSIRKAHSFQTELISAEANGEKTEISLILIHGQDHLMNAMTVRDLAEQMIKMYRKIEQK